MKKILHIQIIPKLSGVQKISLEIFGKLPDSEYEKWIMFGDKTSAGDMGECVRQFENTGAKVILSPNIQRNIGGKDIRAIIEIFKLCRREKFDIVHTHSTKSGIVGRIAARIAGVPLVIHTIHGLAFHKFVKFPLWQFYWMCEMFASCFCDRIILVNKFYAKYFKWFRKKTITVYNGVDFSLFPSIPSSVAAKKQSPVKILFCGRLDDPKDPLSLLRAAKTVCHKYSEIKFTLVGDGEKMRECMNFIRNNGMDDNVDLTGWQNNVFTYYSSHHIFAMSSKHESFGLIFLEAGYYELPSVATNAEGIPEVVKDGETGLLCNPQDHETLAKNIILLIENPQMRRKMGEAARKRVTTLFRSEEMVNEYKSIYEE